MSASALREHLTSSASIVVTGRALVSSLGLDVVSACAAHRAGLTHPSVLEHYDAGGATFGGVPLVVHAVPGVTHGFVGGARLIRLMTAALDDLERQSPDLQLDQRHVGYFLAMPAPGRTLAGADALEDEAARVELQERAADSNLPPDAELAATLLQHALVATRLQSLPARALSITAGHASVSVACLSAAEQLAAGRIELALVIGVDSLLDTDTLVWLEDLQRLRTEQRPAGVMPGEACCVLALESRPVAVQRRARVFCQLESIDVDADAGNILSGAPSTGVVSAELIARPHGHGAGSPWLIIDHNGEPARASEWGNTLFHLAGRGPSYQNPQVWFPATGFGDTAAASGGVAACLAMAAWERGYAPSDRVLICSTSDGPQRAVMRLSRVG